MITAVELPAVQDKPRLFSTFLMWLLADLFHDLPEVGDLDKPKLVFFFDEAHLLFTDASKAFLEAVTQTVRLIRSKGVGVFFVTQNPTDVPDSVLGQLGNRVQHALRAFTPDDAAALREGRAHLPETTDYDLEEALQQLGTGEAIVTVLSESGAPTPVAWTRLRAPRSLMAQIDPAAQQQAVASLAAAAEVRRRRSTGTRPTSGSPPGSPRRRRSAGRSEPRAAAAVRAAARAAAASQGRSARAPRAGPAAGVGGVLGVAGVHQLRPLRGGHARARDHPRAVRHGAPPAPLNDAVSARRPPTRSRSPAATVDGTTS